MTNRESQNTNLSTTKTKTNKILELKNTLEMKQSLDWPNSRCEIAQRISKLKITQSQEQRGRSLKKNEQNPRDLCNNTECINIYLMGIPEEEREEGVEKNI